MQPHQKHVIMWLYSEQQQHEKKIKMEISEELNKNVVLFWSKIKLDLRFFYHIFLDYTI